MASVLVIGYGNPLRSDDGIGWRAAQNLNLRYAGERRVEVIACHQLGLELTDKIASAGYVVFIDAAEKLQPGRVRSESLQPGTSSRTFTHDLDPASLLASSTELWGRCPEATLITVTGACFAFGQQLSAAVEKALPEVTRMAERIVETHLEQFVS